MSSNADIETRILEMKLDNDQFEKGVRSTIQSLEELEEKLELKDAGDGFDKVSKAANTMQFSSMERSLDAITDKFSLLGNVGLQALERISNKIVDIGENILKGITIDPLTAGWGEFEMKTNSIQTILGGTRKYYKSDAEALREIGKELDALNEYADQTIYSFAQMTENVGKFTNQNIDLKTSTQAIKGIGNWAALVGADSAQMSRAMYNISQALGGGAMKLVDWKSIRFANMATPDVQKLFADIAYAQGGMKNKKGYNLKKDSKQAKQAYQSIISDFEGSLKNGWLTNDIMMNGLKVLSGEISGEDLAKLFGDSEEAQALAAQYAQIAADAKEAATSVKTFTQLVGVLKESLGSGWATTFEKLFGGFEQQKKFFTEISNIIGGFIDRDADSRNSWVDRFANRNKGVLLFQDTIINVIHLLTELWGLAQDVGSKLIDPFGGIYKFYDDLVTSALFGQDGSVESAVGAKIKNLNDVGLTAQHVAGIIADLDLAFSGLYQWFHGEKTDENGNVIEEATPAYENAVKIFAGLGSVVMIALNAIENLFRFGGRILALFEPLASSVLKLFGNVGGILYSIYQNIAGQHTFSDFFNSLYAVISPVISSIVDFATVILDLIAALFDLGTEMDATGAKAENNKLGPFIKTLSDIFEKLPLLLAPVTALLTKVVGGITGFIRGVIGGFPAIKKHVKKEGVTPFQDLKDIVQEFIAEGFGEEAAKSITEWYNNNVKGTLESLVEWFETAYDSIVTFFSELPEKVDKLVARVKAAFNAFSNYNYDASLTPFENFKERMKQTILALFGEEVGSNIIKQYQEHIAPYVNKVAEMIESAFGDVTRTLDGIVEALKADYTGIDNPFDLLQAIALNFLKGYNKDEELGADLENKYPGVLKFFQDLSDTYDKEIKPVVDKVLGWVTNDIPNALNTVWEFLFGKDMLVNKGEGGFAHLEKEHIPGLFDNFLTWINGDGKTKLDEIVKFFSDMWTKINDALFGHDILVNKGEGGSAHLEKEHIPGVFENVLNWAKTDGQKIIDEITNFFTEAWNTLNRILFGYDVPAGQTTTMWQGGHVNGIIDNVQNAYQRVADWCGNDGAKIVKTITEFFLGEETETTDTNGKTKKERVGGLIQDAEKFWNDYGSPAWESIKTVYDEVSTWVNGPGDTVVKAVTDFIFGKEDEKTKERSGGAIDAVVTWYNDNKATLEDVFTNKLPRLFTQIQTVLFGQDVPAGQTTSMWQGGHIKGVVDILQESFGKLKEWIDGEGGKIWDDVSTFILGHEVTGKQGNSWREGGALQAVQAVLDPVWEWIQSTGADVYEYVTTHSFSEMWADLNELFLGHEIIGKQGNSWFEGGIFSDLINTLKPIADFFSRIGTAVFDKISGIDFGEVWNKIQIFFLGYETTEETADIPAGTHIPGLFDRIADLFDRIVTFFESDTWKGIKESILRFFERFVTPVFDLLGGGFTALFDSFGHWDSNKGLFENILGSLGEVSDYLQISFPAMLQQMFPEGFNLGDIVGNLIPDFLKNLWPQEWTDALNSLFGNGGNSGEDSGASAISGLLMNGLPTSAIMGVAGISDTVGLMGIYNQKLAEGQAEIDEADKTTKERTQEFSEHATDIVDGFSENRSVVADALNSILQTIGSFLGVGLNNAATIGTMAIGGLALSNVSDIVQSLTGHEKDSLIQDIADLFTALGDFLSSMAWLIGVGTVSNYIDQVSAANATADEQTGNLEDSESKTETLEQRVNTIDHIFDRVSGLLMKIIGTVALIAGASWGAEIIGDNRIDAWRDEHGMNYGSDTTSIAENMRAIGDAIVSIASTIGVFMDSIFKMAAFEYVLGLLDNKLFSDGEKKLSAAERMDLLINRAVEIMKKLGEAVGSIMSGSLLSLVANNAANSFFGIWVNNWTALRNADGNRTSGGMKSRFDSYSSTIMAVGSLLESFAGALSTVLTTLSITGLFSDYNGLMKKIEILEKVAGIFKDLLGSVSGLVGIMAAKDVTNAIQGLEVNGTVLSGVLGGKENTHSGASDIGTYAKLFVFTALMAVLVLAVSETAMLIMEKHLASASATVMTAASQIQAVIYSVSNLTPEQSERAVEVLKTMTTMFTEMGKWVEGSEYTVKKSLYLRDVLANASIGFKVIGNGLDGFDKEAMINAFKAVGEVMKYLKGEESFDVAEFQGMMSFMALAGQNLRTVSENFSSITTEDIGQLSVVKLYFETFEELAQILSSISALGNFGAGMTFGSGFDVYPFLDFLDHIQEMKGRENLKEAFEQIIEALPDSPELLGKLKRFSDSGGGSIGLFTSGIMGLNYALKEYNTTMSAIGTDNFKAQADTLSQIDQLGASLGEKDFGAIGELNANTRLGLFANDVKALGEGLKELAVVKTDGSDYNFDSLGAFFERLNRIGLLINWDGQITNIGDGFSIFVGQFLSLQTGLEGFLDIISSEKFDQNKLDVVAGFLERIVAIGNLVPEETIKLLNRKTLLPDDRNEVTQENAEKLAEYLTNIATPLPALGAGVASFNKSVHDSGIILDKDQTAKELKVAADFIAQIVDAASCCLNVGAKMVDIYTLSELSNDLWREDGTGLFNIMAKIFDYANSADFDVSGMRIANEAFSAFGAFSQGLADLLNAGSEIWGGSISDFCAGITTIFENGVYPSIKSMPITELQAYAGAFKDLSSALTMSGQAATLAGAIDEAIKSMEGKEIKLVVTPVWNMGDDPSNPLGVPGFGWKPNVTNEYSTNTIQNIQFPDVQTVRLVPEDLSAIRSTVSEAGTQVSGRVSSLGATISGLRVQLDTGVLVGQLVPEIDRRLGRYYSTPRYIFVRNTEEDNP